MKVRFLFLALAALFFSVSASAEIVNFYTPGRNWSYVTGVSLENGKDFAQNTAAVDFSVNLNMKEIQANAGFKGQSSQFDFTTETIYWPTFFNCFNAGVGSILHTNYYHDIFFEIDFLTGIYLGYHTKKKFDCMLNLLYMGKAARIFAIKDEVPWLKNNTMAFKTEFFYRPADWVDIFFSISSYTQYRYMLFLAPDFKLGAEFKLMPVCSLGTHIEVQYIDMFTLSSNLNSVDLRIYSRILLK